jgi:N-acyl-D-aspartate/D-glutamate deacylase
MHDLVIRNGKIVDGTGQPAHIGDVAIDNRKITSVGGKVGAKSTRPTSSSRPASSISTLITTDR